MLAGLFPVRIQRCCKRQYNVHSVGTDASMTLCAYWETVKVAVASKESKWTLSILVQVFTS